MPESHPFRRAVEAHDMDAVRATLRDDVVFHSPVLFRPFEGVDAAVHVVSCVAGLLTDFTYLHELHEGDAVCLHFKAKHGEREIEGIDFLVLDEDGRIADFTVFMRPQTAVKEFSEAMAAALGAPA
jgi:ketosteroid isomerase-like protein